MSPGTLFTVKLTWHETDALLQRALALRNAAHTSAFTGPTPPAFDHFVYTMKLWDSVGQKAAKALHRAWPPLPRIDGEN